MKKALTRTLAWTVGLLALATGAILLFDEADALFGKRREVRDSHDRFANPALVVLFDPTRGTRGRRLRVESWL